MELHEALVLLRVELLALPREVIHLLRPELGRLLLLSGEGIVILIVVHDFYV